MPRLARKRAIAFATLAGVLLLASAGYVAWRRSRLPMPTPGAGASTAATGAPTLAQVQDGPHVLFRNTRLDAGNGSLAVVPFDALDGDRVLVPLDCERVHYAAGHGVCLGASRGFTTKYWAAIFDDRFQVTHRMDLLGIPSRVKVSPDGTRAGLTVFVSGDSYSNASFSTRTYIVDTLSGATLGNLEDFSVTRDGRPFKQIDFNFWGVTFADADRFYATLGTGGHTYLIEGDVRGRRARVLRPDIECPSLSPDGTRVAYKKRVNEGGAFRWRLSVLDLRTMQTHELAETTSVDDQAEWLDNERVAYALPSLSPPGSTDAWAVPADGSGTPKLLVAGAWSPVIVQSASKPGTRAALHD
jgi:hypothetical protein